MMSEPTGEIEIARLFENLSSETGRLAAVAADLDTLLAEVIRPDVGVTANLHLGLQNVDALRQSLEAISTITWSAAKNISSGANFGLPCSALAEGVTILQVRDACLGMTTNELSSPNDARMESFDVVFFEDL